MTTQTDVLEKVDQREEQQTSDQPPEFFHYVRKAKITESAVTGNWVVALCGETFPVTKAAKPGSPVCPDCKKIYDTFRKGD
jgi:Protein of unknown function (DUF3039)